MIFILCCFEVGVLIKKKKSEGNQEMDTDQFDKVIY